MIYTKKKKKNRWDLERHLMPLQSSWVQVLALTKWLTTVNQLPRDLTSSSGLLEHQARLW